MGQEFTKSAGGILVPDHKLYVGGKYLGTILRNGKIIDEFEDDNLVVNEGLNNMLDVIFRGGTQTNPWYLGLFEGNYTPVATVTAATITAASTECVAYASATRVIYNEDAAASQITTNATNRASFVFNATKTIYGAFLVSSSTKSGTGGVLFSAARFSTAKNVDSGDELLLTYQFTASSV